MNFGEILGKAWKILWKHKVLWIFGILAGCASGNSGSSNGGSSNGNSGSGTWDFNGNTPQWMQGMQEFGERMWQVIQPYLWIFIVVAVLLVLIVIVLGVIGKVGLIRGTIKADQDEETHLTFGGVLADSVPFFWRMLGFALVLLAFFLVFAVLLALAVAGLVVGTLGIGIVLLIPLICVLVPVMLVANIYLEQVQVAMVAEDLGVFPAFKRGWQVFRGRLGEMIVMGLILGIGSWIVALVIALPIIITLMPAIISMMMNNGEISQSLTTGTMVFAGIFILVAVFLRGLLTTYVESAWTLTFRRAAAALVRPVEPIAPVVPMDDANTPQA